MSTAKAYKPKSFWKKPEGAMGAVFLGGVVIGGGFLVYSFLPQILAFAGNTLGLAVIILALGAILYMVMDPKMRNLVWYMYKSVMRWVTGLFIKLDPIGILKAYVDDLKSNLKKMRKQIGRLRGQMHQLKELIIKNKKQIKSNLSLASEAKEENNKNVMILKTRQAGRLKESNIKLEDLYKKMEILYRVLIKMEENSTIMMEDVQDQVKVKEVERKAIRTSHSAMKSAMNIIAGNNDKRMMFDQALEAIADDVSQKVGEMEQFMELSDSFMKSVDLQNGVFEEEGLKMLEKWENEGISLLLGDEKQSLLLQANDDSDVLDLSEKPKERVMREADHQNQYDGFFE
jgi:hypothetical protein